MYAHAYKHVTQFYILTKIIKYKSDKLITK